MVREIKRTTAGSNSKKRRNRDRRPAHKFHRRTSWEERETQEFTETEIKTSENLCNNTLLI